MELKLTVIYTFDVFESKVESKPKSDFNLNLEMLKLSISTIKAELNPEEILVYTSQSSSMSETLKEFPVKVIQLNADEFGLQDVDRKVISDTYQRFTNFTSHSRIFIINQLLKQGKNVLYMDNDTGIYQSTGSIVLNGLRNVTQPYGYCYEFPSISDWHTHTVQISSDPTFNTQKLLDILKGTSYFNLLNKQTINAGILYYPANELTIKISDKTCEIYLDLLKYLPYCFGQDQTAISLGYYSYLNEANLTFLNPTLHYLMHYYREKHINSHKYAELILREINEFGIKWSDIMEKNYDSGVLNINDHYKHGIFHIFNIETKQDRIYDHEGFIFYPHMDSIQQNNQLMVKTEFNDNLPSWNSNQCSRGLVCYADLFKRFTRPESGIYIKQLPNAKIINKKIIHQIWLGPHERPEILMEMFKAMHSNIKYRLWSDSDVDGFRTKETEKLFNVFDSIPDFRTKAKILSYLILQKYGGIYFDADCMPLRPLEDELFTHHIFFAFENELLFGNEMAHNVIGCIPESPFIRHILDNIVANSGIDLAQINSILRLYQEVFIYPSYFFYPTHYYGVQADSVLVQKAYCHHYWMSEQGMIKLNYKFCGEEAEKILMTDINKIDPKKIVYLIRLIEESNWPTEKIINTLKLIYQSDHRRIDILYKLGCIYHETENYVEAYKCLHTAAEYIIKHNQKYIEIQSKESIFIPSRIRDFDVFDELSIVCHAMGDEPFVTSFPLGSERSANSSDKSLRDEPFVTSSSDKSLRDEYYAEGCDAIDELIDRCQNSINCIILKEEFPRIQSNAQLLGYNLTLN